LLDQEKIKKIQELHAKGLTQKQISRQTGVSPPTIRKYLKALKKDDDPLNRNRILISSFLINTKISSPESQNGTFGVLQSGCAPHHLFDKLNELFSYRIASSIISQIKQTGIERGYFAVDIHKENDGRSTVEVVGYPHIDGERIIQNVTF
jgi:transcriptional regulator with XRE-family HTH domain